MTTKVCTKCEIEKDINEFHKNKRSKDGHRPICKPCVRQYVDDNIERKREYERNNGFKYKELHNKKAKKYRDKPENKKKLIELRQTEEYKQYHREYTTTPEYREYKNNYRQEHYDEIRPKELERERQDRQKPENKILGALRARLGVLLIRSKTSKSDKFVNIIGCTMPFLRTYLESLWQDGMSWDNYGFGRGRWVIDHIIPCDSFKPFTPEQQKQCFNYKNLQPLWWEDNAAKSNKIL